MPVDLTCPWCSVLPCNEHAGKPILIPTMHFRWAWVYNDQVQTHVQTLHQWWDENLKFATTNGEWRKVETNDLDTTPLGAKIK